MKEEMDLVYLDQDLRGVSLTILSNIHLKRKALHSFQHLMLNYNNLKIIEENKTDKIINNKEFKLEVEYIILHLIQDYLKIKTKYLFITIKI